MKTKEELEVLSEEALKVDSERHELTDDEKYWFRRGFIIAYQKKELESDLLHNVVSTSKCEHEPKHYDTKYTSCKKCGMMLQMKP